MGEIFDAEAHEYACPYHDFKPCMGSRCMAFRWSGPTHDRCETDNLVQTEDGLRPVGSPAAPEGEGWEMDGPSYSKGYHRSDKDKLPKATGQRWIKRRELVRGSCGRVASDGFW